MTKFVKIKDTKLAVIINGTPLTRENDGTRGGFNDGTRGGVIVGRRFPAIISQRGGVIQNTAKNCAVFAPTRPLELQRRTSRPFSSRRL
jgi:hypothetical protein